MKGLLKTIRFIVKRLIRASPVPVLLKEKLLFFFRLGYWPDFNSPKSFSEKLNVRKLYDRDQRFVQLSDKIQVRDFVAHRIGEKHLIPILYSGKHIDSRALNRLGDNIVVKRNNDSGSVYVIGQNNKAIAGKVCRKILRQSDYGKWTNEWWYREIEPQILVEKRLATNRDEYRPIDYKIFVFNNRTENYLFVEAIRRRKDGKTECSCYDADLNLLKHNGQDVRFRGCLPFSGPFPAADSFPEMKEIALKLSEGFEFVRIDLYSIEGKVYFGEMTFCPSEGRSCFQPVEFEFFLGEKWDGAPILDESTR